MPIKQTEGDKLLKENKKFVEGFMKNKVDVTEKFIKREKNND